MNKKTSIFISFILLLTILSCTKYEDGPIITFRGKKVRLEGTWKYQSIIHIDNGLEVTENLPTTLFTYSKDGTYSESTGNKGTWKFSGSVDLKITDTTQVEVSWEIIRLSNKQLWLRRNNIAHHYIPN
jgi:hypothetical protein